MSEIDDIVGELIPLIIRFSADLEAKLRRLNLNVNVDKVREVRKIMFELLEEIARELKQLDITING